MHQANCNLIFHNKLKNNINNQNYENKCNIKFTIYFQFSECNLSHLRGKKYPKRNKGEKLSDMISLANLHCSKIHSNIETTHNTQEKKHQVLFATTRKLNKKHTRFLKEAFLFTIFFKILPSRIFEGISYHFVFVSVSLFCYFPSFFFKQESYLKQASQALVNVTDMFSVTFGFLKSKSKLNH